MRNDIYLKEMGGKIRAARKAKKMSMESLGELINMNISNISFIERGKTNPHLLTLKSIADVLKVNLRDLLSL
jgi:transcriptional regulator with XRE-family HTH domain